MTTPDPVPASVAPRTSICTTDGLTVLAMLATEPGGRVSGVDTAASLMSGSCSRALVVRVSQ